MNGFRCGRHKLLTFGLHVNWNLSLGLESFWFTRHFSEMNGLPLLTRWEQRGSGVRCYSTCVCTECVHVYVCECDHTRDCLQGHCLISYHHRLTPQSPYSTWTHLNQASLGVSVLYDWIRLTPMHSPSPAHPLYLRQMIHSNRRRLMSWLAAKKAWSNKSLVQWFSWNGK